MSFFFSVATEVERAFGKPCKLDDECQTNVCKNQKCAYPANEGEACSRNEECSAGFECRGDKCQPLASNDTSGDIDGRIDLMAEDLPMDVPQTYVSAGLTWQVTPTGESMDFSSAKTHCQSLTLDGGGWRLPTIGELRTLLHGCAGTMTDGECKVTDECLSSSTCWGSASCRGCTPGYGPADGCYWPAVFKGTCDWYWSSSEDSYYHAMWAVDFNAGGLGAFGISSGYVRCVK